MTGTETTSTSGSFGDLAVEEPFETYSVTVAPPLSNPHPQEQIVP
jgi:hypothetical protein